MRTYLKQYKPGFSLFGLLAFALQELPYLPWLLWPPADNPLAHNDPANATLGIMEQAGGVLTIALLVVIRRRSGEKPQAGGPFFRGAILCLAVYYGCWIGYFAGITDGWLIVLGLSAVVPLYYLFTALWLKNHFAAVTSVVFLIGHTVSNGINFLGM